MKKLHFTLIFFLIIQSVFSQVELRVNENKRISLNDTLTITADISHLKNSSILKKTINFCFLIH